MTREPSEAAILSARIQRAYPSLSPYSAASLAHELCRIERAQRRHAERCCSGEDGGYVRRRSLAREDDCAGSPCVIEHDPEAEQRAGERIERRVEAWQRRIADLVTVPACADWYRLPSEDKRARLDDFHKTYTMELQGDPRGRVLLLQLPGEPEPS